MLKCFDDQRWATVHALARLAVASGWPVEELEFRHELIHRHFRGCKRIRRLAESGANAAARRAQDVLLKSYAGRACAVVRQIVPKAKHIAPKAMSVEAFDAFARRIRPDRRISGVTRMYLKKKPDGGDRPITNPGDTHRAAQLLVEDGLASWGLNNPFEFNRSKRGRDAAIQEIIRLIEEEGVRHFVVIDIKNFFASVKPSHLKWLPLPRQVMLNSVLFNRNAVLLHGEYLLDWELKVARQGLPQGARLSGLLASLLLGREIHSLSGTKGSVAFVDDVAIGACDLAGAHSLAKTLQVRLTTHPDGPLEFRSLEVVTVEEGFSFLGYHIRMAVTDGAKSLVLEPSEKAKLKFRLELVRKLRVLGDKVTHQEALKRAHDYLASWATSFQLWRPSDAEAQEFVSAVEGYVDELLGGLEVNKPHLPYLLAYAAKSAVHGPGS